VSQHALSAAEQLTLTTANRMLTRLTATHHHSCGCELCEARMLIDVQEMPKFGWTVNGVTLAGDEEVTR
jgi:hypothetical protein